MIIEFTYGLILAAAHFVSDKVAEHKRYQVEIRSIAAGISLTYLLMYLLPEIYAGTNSVSKQVIMFILLGAISLHLIEKYLYQHKKREKLISEMRVLHALSFFTYHIIIGIVLVNIISVSQISGLLFFIPILFYTAVSQVSLHNLHAGVTELFITRLVLSSSTLIGVAIATFINVPFIAYFSLLAFIAGALLYNVMVEVIPKEKEGNILFFMLGTFVYLMTILTLGPIY